MKLIQIGVCALLVFAVAAHGGVEDWARAMLETFAGILFVIWAVRAYLSPADPVAISPLQPPLAALTLLVLGQIVLGGTVCVYDTRMDLMLLVAYLLIFFIAAQVFRTGDDWRFFAWFVMSFGFLVAIFGILQHLTFNGKLYWFREMRYGGIPFGPYANRNHFAGFAELVIPVALVPLVLGKVVRCRPSCALSNWRAVLVCVARRFNQFCGGARRSGAAGRSASRRRKARARGCHGFAALRHARVLAGRGQDS